MNWLTDTIFMIYLSCPFLSSNICTSCDKWVPVTTAWRVLRLRMEERRPIWRVAANKLNKQSRTVDKGWSSNLGVGRGANNASPYSLPNILRVVKSRRMSWAGHVASMGQGRGVYRDLVGKPEGKRPLGRPRRRWEDNIKMDIQEVGGGCGDWMELAQDRDRWRALVSTVMNLQVPKMRGIS